MNEPTHITERISQVWQLNNIHISHSIIDYEDYGKMRAQQEEEYVRLHFGLQGSYAFKWTEFNASFDLSGHHNNILYSDGLEIEVENKSKRIETFGINFSRESFIDIAQNGNDPLKRLAEKVANRETAILSNQWASNPYSIQQVISEIIYCPYTNELRDLFLLSKSIELLVLQAALYEEEARSTVIKSKADKAKLIEAKDLLMHRMENPPTIVELSKLVGLNEYKLKKGFKELFGTTIFGYIHNSRMSLAKRLLLGSDKSAKEIAFETGYSSPQHFSKAFKKAFGVAPNRMRKTPDSTP